MRPSRIKAKLKQGDPVLVTTCHLTDPSVFELTSLMGFDGIWMDLEHHGYSVETATNLMRAARVGTSDIMARPAKGEFMRLGRLLEAGAQGIMYPRCDDAAEAREVVRWSKFAPLGSRGYDSGNPDNPYVTLPFEKYVKQANQETFLVIQIESPDALERADEIAAVEGIDVLFFGPSDFSLLSGIPGQFDHPKIEDATNRIAAAAKVAGKHWGMPCFSKDHASRLLEQGARFLARGGDIVLIKQAFQGIQADFATLGFTFDNRL